MISSDKKNSLTKLEVEALAKHLIKQWLSPKWQFKWDHAKTRFGLCHYQKKTIQLSLKLYPFLSKTEILDVIKHEIAHALAGHENGHNPIWKKFAIQIGAEPKSSKHIEFDSSLIGAKYTLQDANGEIYRYYYRKPVKAIKSLDRMWIRGKKKTTFGQLMIKEI